MDFITDYSSLSDRRDTLQINVGQTHQNQKKKKGCHSGILRRNGQAGGGKYPESPEMIRGTVGDSGYFFLSICLPC